ncbi:MAG: hypothetical protein HC907_22090 [Richelia sp. SM1_7_0]|nr:hypothetical protein [Richelia sp. SM1_7_0]
MVSSKERKEVIKRSRQAALGTHEYKIFSKRAYNDKIGFASYKEVTAQISCQLSTIDIAHQLGRFNDLIWRGITYSFWGAMTNNNFGVYAIAPELMQDFKNSSPPSQVWKVEYLFDRALFLFPKGSIVTPDKEHLDWILIDFLTPNFEVQTQDEYEQYLTDKLGRRINLITPDYPGKDTYRIRWCSFVNYQYLYHSIVMIENHEKIEQIPRSKFFYDCDQGEEEAFVNHVTGLILQILRYMSKNTSSIEEDAPIRFIKHKKHKPGKSQAKPPKNFIVVGKNYQSLRSPHSFGGSHRSPEEHSRRGHYRILPWRPASDNQVWVRPTIVNKGH